ncbi:MAG: hypothetical protein O9337_19885 [Acidovorax sp.]|uniref:hypothetical protein n=1 Tax=Acidovorax sp. TaxID=1872122 RepID=UPI0022C1756D|nr:hypothetical protein [Acidovorax sp.]MCZ8221690.1 hypothetical protein [Acidovorax sp.]
MPRLRLHSNGTAAMLLALGQAMACSLAQAAGFGAPSGSWPVHPLPLQVPQGALSPLMSSSLYRADGEPPAYYLSAGAGVPRLQIPDLPGATAWAVVPDGVCAHLAQVPMDVLKTGAMEPVVVQRNPLPMDCAAAFEGACTSRDGQLRISTSFDGQRRKAQVRGGFYGSEGLIDTTFYTGTRTLQIEHLPSGQAVRMREPLVNDRGYSAPQTAIRYLPELRLVLLLGVTQNRGMPVAHCMALPPQPPSPPSSIR